MIPYSHSAYDEGTTGGEMNPFLGQFLVGMGTSLFKGLFSGMGKKAEDKRRWNLFMKRMKEIKPSGKYSRGVDPVTEAAIMNTFANRGMQVPQYTGYGEGGGT